MSEKQKALFQNQGAQTKNCIRCGMRCRVVEKVTPGADLFVKGTMRTGKFCANCLVVDFFKNCDIGPSSSLGKEYFDHSLPWPEWRQGYDREVRFDPESLRLPHVQEQWRRIIAMAQTQYSAELFWEEIDWDEVIANWHLPFPEKPKRKGRRR